jgi:hypothetical protein
MTRLKARHDDHVITVRPVTTQWGDILPVGTHGFVIEAIAGPPEQYEVEFYVPRQPPAFGDDLELVTVLPADFNTA